MFEVKRYFIDGSFYVESESALDVLDLFLDFKDSQPQKIGIILEGYSEEMRCDIYHWTGDKGNWLSAYKQYEFIDPKGKLERFINLLKQSIY